MDTRAEGNSGKPFRMVVEEGKIREFARSVKSSNPAYVAEGQPQATSPVTFLASGAFWQGPENSPWTGVELNWQRILHGEQEFTFTGPPPAAGTVLTAQSRIDRVYEKEGKRGGTMMLAESVTEYRDDAGRLVAESRSTLIETGKAPGELTMTITWTDLDIGTEGPALEDGPLTVTDFVRYQGASGDINPIHHDSEFASAAGFSKPFAVGMRQMGVLATWATDWLGPMNVRRFKVQWREQAWPGDVLTYAGAVTAKREEDGQQLVDLEMTVTRQSGGTHLKGWATFVVPG